MVTECIKCNSGMMFENRELLKILEAGLESWPHKTGLYIIQQYYFHRALNIIMQEREIEIVQRLNPHAVLFVPRSTKGSDNQTNVSIENRCIDNQHALNVSTEYKNNKDEEHYYEKNVNYTNKKE